ncbi:MAG: rhodanese-like domain-containing protein [Candidatus Limnocylindrales bacterium]
MSTNDPSTEALRLITGRRSAPALTTPPPTDEQLRAILAAAASVPDHGRLRPYRFVVVAGEARLRFGTALREAAVEADADPVTIAKASRKPMFGPLQVVIIASPRAHPTVPQWEQEASATLTGYAMELAAAALGVGAAWKSGHHLDQAPIRRLFAMTPGERMLGWINLGTTTTTSDKPSRDVDAPRPDPVVSELRADPLMRVEELAARLDHPSVRVCDVRWFLGDPARGRREYLEGHIPGAIAVDLETDLSDHDAPDSFGRHPLPDPAWLAARMGALGIGPDDAVVVYDEGPGTVAARLWWMLDALGHRGVRLLDGGLAAWRAAGLPLETGPGTTLPGTELVLATSWPRVIGRDELRDRLGTLALLDVRAGERYRGEVEPVDPVPGHIPTARSAPAGGNTAADGRLLSPDALHERYASLAGDLTVVVSCGSGVTACQAALAMRVAGLADPILYAGSYSDWTRAGLPVATGSEAGPPA